MKTNAFLVILIISSALFARQPEFKECNTPECHREKLTYFEAHTLHNITKDVGFTIADSLYFRFDVSENGELDILQQYAFASAKNLHHARLRLDVLARLLKPTEDKDPYEWVLKIAIPEKAYRYKPHTEVKNLPPVEACSRFNKLAREACFYYVLDEIVEKIRSQKTYDDSAEFLFYVKNARVEAVEVTRRPADIAFTDRATFILDSAITQVGPNVNGWRADDLTLTFPYLGPDMGVNADADAIVKAPAFKGCEDDNAQEECFRENLSQHFAANFRYPEDALRKNVQGKVEVEFTITEKGKYNYIKITERLYRSLDFEAIRLISILPSAKEPAKSESGATAIRYSVPITAKMR